MVIINLGCGAAPIKGAVNVDRLPSALSDVTHDLDVTPWPFEDGQADRVVAQDVVEHVADVVGFVQECHRVLKVGGELAIRTPVYKHENSWIDPTHRHHLALDSFDYFDPATTFGQKYGYYSACKFEIVEKYVDADGNIVLRMRKR